MFLHRDFFIPLLKQQKYMKYQVENSKFEVVFETNLSLEEAQEFIEKTQQEELELFLHNREVFRIVEQADDELLQEQK